MDTTHNRTHPLAAIAEIQSEIIRRNRERENEIAEGLIGLVDLRSVESRIGQSLQLTTSQEDIDLGLKRVEALIYISKRPMVTVRRRRLLDLMHRRQHAPKQAPVLTLVK